MKKIFLLVCIIILGTGWEGKAQFQASRLTFGGGLGLQFGDYTMVNIAPQVGYNFSQYFNAGAGFTYSHYKQKSDHNHFRQTNNYLGFNVYGRFYPIPYIILQVQPEVNRMWRSLENRVTHEKVKDEKFIPVCLIGGGIRFGPITAMIQYDIAQNGHSPYGNRLFYSLGYTFGF